MKMASKALWKGHRCHYPVRRSLARPKGRSLFGGSDPIAATLIALFTELLSGAFSGQGLLHPALLARLQVEGVPLYVLNDVLRLHFALKPTKGVLQRLTLL